MVKEVWRTVSGFPMLQASNLGRIRRRDDASIGRHGADRVYRPRFKDERPYFAIRVMVNGRRRNLYVHRLVCLAFKGPAPPKHDAAHHDGNSVNNLPSNLKWATRKENNVDKIRHGTIPKGDQNNRSKLRCVHIPKIREMIKAGATLREIGKQFGVTAVAIHAIKTNRTWTHV